MCMSLLLHLSDFSLCFSSDYYKSDINRLFFWHFCLEIFFWMVSLSLSMTTLPLASNLLIPSLMPPLDICSCADTGCDSLWHFDVTAGKSQVSWSCLHLFSVKVYWDTWRHLIDWLTIHWSIIKVMTHMCFYHQIRMSTVKTAEMRSLEYLILWQSVDILQVDTLYETPVEQDCSHNQSSERQQVQSLKETFNHF